MDTPSVQGQVGWGLRKPGLAGGNPVHSTEVGTRWSLKSLPIHSMILRLYEVMGKKCGLLPSRKQQVLFLIIILER